jgi:hypothetical protein
VAAEAEQKAELMQLLGEVEGQDQAKQEKGTAGWPTLQAVHGGCKLKGCRIWW